MGYAQRSKQCSLTFIKLWTNSADYILVTLFLFFPESRIYHFMHFVFIEDNLQAM